MTMLVAGGVLAAAVAALATWQLWRRRELAVLAGGAAVAVAITLLGPTLAIEVSETLRFVRLGLADAGLPRNVEPPLSEELVAAARRELRTGDRWALVTPVGRCTEDELAYQWLAFRLHPAQPDCTAADVTVYAGVAPPPTATVQSRSDTGSVVR